MVTARLRGDEDQIKEHTLAIQVFERREDFDGRIDTIVRVQAHRLREKLDRYYSRVETPEGGLRITLPRGAYCPEFEPVSPDASAAAEPEAPAAVESADSESTGAHAPPAVEPPPRPSRRPAVVAGALLVVAALAGFWLGRSGSPAPGAPSLPPLDPDVATLWASFLSPTDEPALIVYNPTIFLSNSVLLLRYDGPYEAPTDTPISRGNPYLAPFVDSNALEQLGPFVFNYSWGPTGLVAQTYYLTDMLAMGGRRVTLRSRRRLDTADVRDRDTILLGRFALAELWNQPPFTFEQPAAADDPRQTSGPPPLPHIRNHEPADGEPAIYSVERDEATQAREIDYGFFAMAPGPRGRRLAVCTGISTFGAWGATQFVTSPRGARAILDRLGSPPPPYFQAVVRATIDRETIQSVELVAARPMQPLQAERLTER